MSIRQQTENSFFFVNIKKKWVWIFCLKSSVPYEGGNVIQKNFLKLLKLRFGGTLSPQNGNRYYFNIMANKLAQAFRERNIHTIFERKQ